MPRSDPTYTSRDVIRIYENNLDPFEKNIVEAYFGGGSAPTSGFVNLTLSTGAYNALRNTCRNLGSQTGAVLALNVLWDAAAIAEDVNAILDTLNLRDDVDQFRAGKEEFRAAYAALPLLYRIALREPFLYIWNYLEGFERLLAPFELLVTLEALLYDGAVTFQGITEDHAIWEPEVCP